ncbi:MAG: hypothetical protein ABIH87_04135 [bacterium]
MLFPGSDGVDKAVKCLVDEIEEGANSFVDALKDQTPGGHEFLAKQVFDPESLESPLECSPIHEARKKGLHTKPGVKLIMRHNVWPTYLALPFTLFVSLVIAIVVWPYEVWYLRKFKKLKQLLEQLNEENPNLIPTDEQKKRMERYQCNYLLGPKWLSVLLGWLTHPRLQMLREGVTTSKALRALHGTNVFFRKEIPRLSWWRRPGAYVAWFIMDSMGPQAVNNRCKKVHQIIYAEMVNQYMRAKQVVAGNGHSPATIQMASLACGSAEPTLFAVAHFLEDYPGADVRLRLVDLNPDMLDAAMQLAEELGIQDHVERVEQNIRVFLKQAKPESLHVVDFNGFIDYKPVKKAIGYISLVRNLITPGGLFTVSQIGRSGAGFGVRWLINWPELKPRTVAQHKSLVIKAGWPKHEVAMDVEPHKGHAIAICRRGGLTTTSQKTNSVH